MAHYALPPAMPWRRSNNEGEHMKRVMTMVAVLALGLGSVQLAGAADGKAAYDKKCKSCHNSGMMGAPKFGDKEAWSARAKAGMATLEESVLKGKGKMPKQDMAAEDIKAATEYLAKSGQ